MSTDTFPYAITMILDTPLPSESPKRHGAFTRTVTKAMRTAARDLTGRVPTLDYTFRVRYTRGQWVLTAQNNNRIMTLAYYRPSSGCLWLFTDREEFGADFIYRLLRPFDGIAEQLVTGRGFDWPLDYVTMWVVAYTTTHGGNLYGVRAVVQNSPKRR